MSWLKCRPLKLTNSLFLVLQLIQLSTNLLTSGYCDRIPDSYTLGEAVYVSLFSDEWWGSKYPPFRNHEALAKYLVENSYAYRETFKLSAPTQQILVVQDKDNHVLLYVLHAHKSSTGKMIVVGKTRIDLPRVAGGIGYGEPKISVEIWTGSAIRTLDSLGVELC